MLRADFGHSDTIIITKLDSKLETRRLHFTVYVRLYGEKYITNMCNH